MKIKLYKILIKNSIKEISDYKATFILIVIFGLLFTSIEIFSTYIYYRDNEILFGWTRNEFLLLVISFALIQYLYQFLFTASHESLADNIVEGNLDYTFVRPVNSYFFNALYRIDFPSLINLFLALGISIYFLIILKLNFNIWLLYYLFIVLGVWFYFIICQIAVTISFWLERADIIIGLPEYILDSSNKPRTVYPKFIQIIFIYIIPSITSINGPVDVIRGRLVILEFIYYIIFLIFLTMLSYYLWKRGMIKYSSAN